MATYLITSASVEPRRVQEHFDARGWPGEARSHAEVAQVFRRGEGWKILPGRTKISHDWLLKAQADDITSIALRVRYADRRTVTADFSVKELLKMAGLRGE
jgi:hypothetical protein